MASVLSHPTVKHFLMLVPAMEFVVVNLALNDVEMYAAKYAAKYLANLRMAKLRICHCTQIAHLVIFLVVLEIEQMGVWRNTSLGVVHQPRDDPDICIRNVKINN